MLATQSLTPHKIPSSASGGVITNYDGFRVHTFTTTGSAQYFVNTSVPVIEVLVVAGAGGGGRAGGGGAGGLIQIMEGIGNVNTIGLLPVTASTYTINIGIAGVGHPIDGVNGKTNGGDTTMSGAGITTLTAKGGGYGGWSNAAGVAGGSGGGGGFNDTSTAPASNQATGVGSYPGIGFGNEGGGGSQSAASNSGGGGGGAGGTGGDGFQVNPPEGGIGKQININGTNTWFSGGGSGAGHYGTNVYSQAQTQGSGYTTADHNSSTLVLPTTYGSGGAAMHGATSANNSKMYGMQGIVIIRYAV
jgi:hypothetical protein